LIRREKSKGGKRKHGTGGNTTDGATLVPQEIGAVIGDFSGLGGSGTAIIRAGKVFRWIGLIAAPTEVKIAKSPQANSRGDAPCA
jgi:hypothetical protein